MKTDLVLSPFDAHMPAMLEAAAAADEAGFDGVWIYDHFSASMVGKSWSHHPFTALGAIATVTSRLPIGCLVSNIANRHVTQLGSALGTLASLAPGRVRCGLGAGAGPGTPFSTEHDTIARPLAVAATRRRQLGETIDALRSLWAGEAFSGIETSLLAGAAIVPPIGTKLPIIVGASTLETALIAVRRGCDLNLRASDALFEHVRAVRSASGERPIEIGVNDLIDLDHPLGGDIEEYSRHGIECRTLAIRAPYDVDRIHEIGANLAANELFDRG